jgi:hypothetical protein
MDCFVAPLLAMTTNHTSAFPRRVSPGLCKLSRPRERRGRGECRVRAAPAVSCAKLCEKTHTSIQVQRKHSGIPRAMALRLMARSPRRRIRLVTVAAGLMASRIRSDRLRHRQLDTSNGCRNHTLLPYASAPFVLRAVVAHERTRPANNLRADAAASTASRPTFVTMANAPLLGPGWGELLSLICPTHQEECFPREGLTAFFDLPVALICRSLGASRRAKACLRIPHRSGL